MRSGADIVVYFVTLLGIAAIVFGLIGIIRRKISLHYRNHAWEGRGAVLFSLLFLITGIGLVLSVIL